MSNDDTAKVTMRTDISLSLVPDMLMPHQEGLDIEGSLGQPIYKTARETLASMYNSLGAMLDARDKVIATVNPNDPNAPRVMAKADKRTGTGAAIQILSGREDDLREALSVAFDRAARDYDRRLGQIKNTRDALAKRINAALVNPQETTATGIAMASDIRKYAREVDDKKRSRFIEERIERGDLVTVSALLNAPEYLSGIDDDKRAFFRDLAAEKFAKQDRLQLLAADRVIDHLMTAARAMMEKFNEILPPKRATKDSAADQALRDLKTGRAA